MKNITKYALFCGCILALSSCQEKQLGAPELEIDESAPISFAMDVAGTKGLIETQEQLDNENTVIKVYDYVSGEGISINGQGAGYYINDSITGTASGAWPYVSQRTYYWTKTGTHKFYGWLSVDGNNATDLTAAKLFGSEPTINGQKLVLPSIEMTPASTQLDFLYSDIQSYTMPARPTTAVPLKFYHLFTALAVDVVNETGDALKDFTLSLGAVHPTQSAAIDWGTEKTVEGKEGVFPTVTYTPTDAASMELGKTDLANATDTKHFFGDDEQFRLLWPQDISASTLVVAYDIEDETVTGGKIHSNITASLKDVFKTAAIDGDTGETITTPVNNLDAGHKYLLKITIKPSEVLFKVIVDPLDEKYYEGMGGDHEDYLIKLI